MLVSTGTTTLAWTAGNSDDQGGLVFLGLVQRNGMQRGEKKMVREKIAIYGTGNTGKEAFYKLSTDYEVVLFYNSNCKKWGSQYAGVPITGFQKSLHPTLF